MHPLLPPFSWNLGIFLQNMKIKVWFFFGGGVRGKGNGERGDEWSLEGLEGLLG